MRVRDGAELLRTPRSISELQQIQRDPQDRDPDQDENRDQVRTRLP